MMEENTQNQSRRRPLLHVMFTCPVCQCHCTNYYELEDWEQHRSDLEDAFDDELICENCLQGVPPPDDEAEPHVGQWLTIEV